MFLPTHSNTAAHPRVCGENLTWWSSTEGTGGSSPRVRGKLATNGIERAEGRLIPACAGKTRRACGPESRPRAHPRVCGENILVQPEAGRPRGSSPRVRGKLPVDVDSGVLGGLIPACAGKTARARSHWAARRAHPRVCGENVILGETIDGILGSSPRVRGKRGATHHRRAVRRLIPACAGKTRTRTGSSSASRAHPRVCGENCCCCQPSDRHRGSSPRVRGKQSSRSSTPRLPGLIPACAGKTPGVSPPSSLLGAHPRVCGENNPRPREQTSAVGSSPRVRGKRQQAAPDLLQGRLIPACAGKTSQPPAAPSQCPAHPRVCGENLWAITVRMSVVGSSPRVRGKRRHRKPPELRRRLIPACAGKTRGDPHPWTAGPAHPRVCGENLRCPGGRDYPQGSSPRVRGKLMVALAGSLESRLIPACAGKTTGTGT